MGLAKFGRLIDQGIAQALPLTESIARQPGIELMASTVIDVVCLRLNPGGWWKARYAL